jgi:hypothetical protein
VCRLLVKHIFDFEKHSVKSLCSLSASANRELCNTFLHGQGPDFYSQLRLLVDRAPDPCGRLGLCPLPKDSLLEETSGDMLFAAAPGDDALVAEEQSLEGVPDTLYQELDDAHLGTMGEFVDPDGIAEIDDHTDHNLASAVTHGDIAASLGVDGVKVDL